MKIDKEMGYQLPLDYHPAMFDKQMLRNDFVKFQKLYPWAPHPEKLAMTMKAVDLILGPHLVGSVITYEQAVLLMDKTKSPGHPYNQKYKTKQEALDAEGPEIKRAVEELRRTGKCVFTFDGKVYTECVWQSSPKGEMRVMDKLIHPKHEKRKCRTFMCNSIIFHILMFMLFKEQNDSFVRSHDSTWSKVGFSPYYGGFNTMASYLLSSGIVEFDCWDVEHMEAFNEILLLLLYELRRNHLIGCSPEDERQYKFILTNIVWSLVLDPDGYLGLMLGKNPSGSFNTLVDNTIILDVMWVYILARKCTTLDQLLEKCKFHKLALMGDDSVVPHHEDFYGAQDIALELGFTIKPEAPTGPLSSAKFVNCNFSVVKLSTGRDYWLPHPNFDKILANIFFHFKSSSWRLAFVKCCALRVLAWNHPEMRKRAELMIGWIRRNKDLIMQHEISMDDTITYESAVAAYLPVKQIQFMWYGDESAPLVGNGISSLAYFAEFRRRDEACPFLSDGLTEFFKL